MLKIKNTRKLSITRETIRAIGALDMGRVVGGDGARPKSAATDGMGNCESELSDCPTHV